MIASSIGANAGEPVAIVENAPQRTNLEIMDYLQTGRTITLLEGETLVVGYLVSCVREVIVGGAVTIGFEQSVVDGGKVDRRKVDCSGSGMILSREQMQEGGVLVFRGISEQRVPVSYSLQPVISLTATGPLTIRRVDRQEPSLQFEKKTDSVEFHGTHVKFAAGGIYQIEVANKSYIFAIAPSARLMDSPLISRLIRFR